MDVRKIRQMIPIVKSLVYLDNAGTGPPTNFVTREMRRCVREWSTKGEYWEKWFLEIVEARKLFGKLIGVDGDEVACVPNVTVGLVAVACSIDHKPGSNVVIGGNNFPTNVYLWHLQRKKRIVKEVRLLHPKNGIIPLEEYAKAIDDNTSLVSVDYVAWLNGCREKIREIAEIAHKHGALMIVDAFHALGVMPVDARRDGIDVLTSGVYKWLMGPHGAAFVYVKREMLDQMQPSFTGWHGIKGNIIERFLAGTDPFIDPFDLEDAIPAETASRFEWGTWPPVSIVGAKEALSLAVKDDMKDRYGRISSLTTRLIDGLQKSGKRILSPLHEDRRSGIVSYVDEDQSNTVARLKKRRIIVSGRVKMLRVSPHFYNTKEEIDHLLDVIGKFHK